MKKILILISILFSTVAADSQQLPTFANYSFNLASVNAAYIGSRKSLNAVATHRAQWVGLEGAPRMTSAYVHGPWGRKPMAIGGEAHYDAIGARKTAGAAATFAYHLRLNNRYDKIGLAVRAGMFQSSIDYSKLRAKDPNDPNLVGQQDAIWLPVFDFAALFHNERTYAGIEVKHMNEPAFLETDQMMTRLVPQLTIIGGHTFKINNEFDFKPSMLLRSAKLAPFLAEINAAVLYEDRIWAGLGYRYKSGFTALAQIQFEKHFIVGYSYEHSVSTLPQAGWSTHEITLGYELQMFRGETVSPRYF